MSQLNPLIWALVGLVSTGLGATSIGKFASTQHPGWLLLLTPLLVLIVFWAPYQLWKEQTNRAVEAEAKLTPRISVQGKVRSTQNNKTACIMATNLGERDPIRQCVGRLVHVYRETDGELELLREIQPTLLQWSARYGGGANLDIGTQAELDVVTLEDSDVSNLVIVSADSQLRRQMYVLPRLNVYVLTIELKGENTSSVTSDFKLVTSTNPILYRQDGAGDYKPVELPQMKFDKVTL